MVIDKASDEVIGSSRFQAYDPADGGSVEIGWTFLARSHWGGASNAEMKRLMLAHALGFVERVDFRIGEANLRSRAALEKIGGRLSDRIEMAETTSGMVRHVVYEITRAGLAAGPLAYARQSRGADRIRTSARPGKIGWARAHDCTCEVRSASVRRMVRSCYPHKQGA